jgi:hypothetical protein
MRKRLCTALVCLTLTVSGCTSSDSGSTVTPVTPVTPTPTMTAGRIASEPVGAVLVSGTTILTAEGFTASDNSAISYAWDLGNGTTQTGLASVRPSYTTAGLYIVRLTATSATGARATATLELRVGSMTGRWRLIDAAGATLSSTAQLTQNGLALTGDDQMAGDCRWTVSGVVGDARLVLLTWTRTAGSCAGRNLPNVFTFTGTGNVDLTGFPGSFSNVTGGTLAGAGRLVPCGTSGC